MAGVTYQFLRRQQKDIQIRRITDWNEAEFSAFLQNPGAYTRENNAAVAFGAYKNDIPAGAAELTAEEGYVGLRSIHVGENLRGSGIGSALLERAKEFAAEMDVDLIVAELAEDERSQALKTFFEAGGFYQTETGGSILTLRPGDLLSLDLFRKMADRGLPQNAVMLDQLPPEQWKKLRHARGRSLAGDLIPGKSDGRILGELSLGCPDEEKGLGAFVLFVQRSGLVCLDAAYTEETYVTPFMRLLAHALSALTVRGVEELYVTVKDAAFCRLLEKLTAEKPELLHRQTLLRMEWNLEDAGIDLEAADRAAAQAAGQEAADGLEILVPRLMRLMDILEAEDIDCDLMLGELPYLLISSRISVHYYPKNDTYGQFALVFSSLLAPGASADGADRICGKISAACQFAAAVSDNENIFLRYAVPEYGAPVGEDMFLACLDTFQAELFTADLLV